MADPTSSSSDEVSLFDLLVVLAKHKKLVVGMPFVFAVLAAGISLLLPNIFTATTKILPPQQNQSTASALLSQLGGLAGLVGGAANIKSPSDVYVAMLKSRTVADNMIQRFDLMNLYEAKYPSEARRTLAGRTQVAASKDGIITIEVDDKDSKRSAAMANAYVDELMKLTEVLAVTEASQRRLFFERQLQQAKDNLVKAETEARGALEKGGLVKVDDQGRAMVEVTARLRAQVAAKEVQIGAMRAFAADQNPDLQLAQGELESLKHQLAKVEGTQSAGSNANADAASGRSGLGNLGLLRNVKYYEVLFELLARQYEAARLDEARDTSMVQVMDKAIEPDRKSKPTRWLIVVITGLFTMLVAMLWAFASEAFENAKRDPQQAERLRTLRRYLAWR